MVTLPSLVRMVWVAIMYGETTAGGELLTVVGHHRRGVTDEV